MSRPIVLTEEIKQKARDDFAAMLDSVKMSDGKFSYSKSFQYEDCNAVVWLTPEAYKKIVALVTGFSDEVGWHGTVSRSGENEFTIEDVFVYPQEVTSSTVVTDQFAYTEWLYELEDDTFNKIRMQGHSHVNMGVSPSGVDDKHRQKILNQLEPDMFYIFMIWNKSLNVHTLIYDMEKNILYENKDVDVMMISDEGMDAFLADAKEKVQKPVTKKSQSGSKKQKESRLALLGLTDSFEEHDSCSMCGMCAAYELEPIGCRAYNRFIYKGG